MANSRLEKIGTIYSRTRGLLESGALKHCDRPIWYDVYEAFPPRDEPRFDRPAPNMPLRKIFYKEDTIRAAFHRNNKHIGSVNLINMRTKSITQRFIDTYEIVQDQYRKSNAPTDEKRLYEEAIEIIRRERESKSATAVEEISLSTAFKRAQEINKPVVPRENVSINVKEIFKD